MLNANEAMDGRVLGGMGKSGTEIAYEYDEKGLRTEKQVNGERTAYTYSGARLTRVKGANWNLYFRYDGNGEAIGVRRNGTG